MDQRPPPPLSQSPPLTRACQRAQPDPAKPERSGVGPERALEANTSTPSRKARKLILLRAYSASGGLMPRNQPKPERSGVGPERALEANTNPLAHSAKDHPSQSLLSERRPDTAEPIQRHRYSIKWHLLCRYAGPTPSRFPTKTRAERCRAGTSLGGEHLNPLAHSAKVHPP